MNNIQRTEAAIKDGTFGEPVLAYRVYGLALSPVHLAEGSDWDLIMSADTEEDARDMISTDSFYSNKDIYATVIIKGKQ